MTLLPKLEEETPLVQAYYTGSTLQQLAEENGYTLEQTRYQIHKQELTKPFTSLTEELILELYNAYPDYENFCKHLKGGIKKGILMISDAFGLTEKIKELFEVENLSVADTFNSLNLDGVPFINSEEQIQAIVAANKFKHVGWKVLLYVCVCLCVYVCVREREKERERVCVCVSVCVCMCVCVGLCVGVNVCRM